MSYFPQYEYLKKFSFFGKIEIFFISIYKLRSDAFLSIQCIMERYKTKNTKLSNKKYNKKQYKKIKILYKKII